MEESRSPGNFSSARPRSEAEAIGVLREIASSPALQTLSLALGTEAKLALVGGTVRDTIMGRSHSDIDLASALPASRVTERLASRGIYVVETGLKHGTITAVIDGRHYEITTFRDPHSQQPARSIEEDLIYRDFSINALAYDLHRMTLVDPCKGLADIQNNILRATGPAEERLRDDPLRILRALRFGHAEGRTVDGQLELACRRLAPLLKQISVERIRTELVRILLAPCAGRALEALRDLELLPYTLPELQPAVGFEQNEFHIHDVFNHTVWVVERCRHDELLRLTALFHDIGKPHTLTVDAAARRHFYRHEEVGAEITVAAMRRLKFSNEQIAAVSNLVRHHMRPMECGPAGVRRLMRDLADNFDAWREFKAADSPPKGATGEFEALAARFDTMYREELARLRGRPYGKLAVSGQDLIELGMREGPAIGVILRQLEELVLDDPSLNDPQILRQHAQRILQRSGAS